MATAIGRNVRFSWAWQSAFDQPAGSAASAWTFNTQPGSAGPRGVQGPEDGHLMGLDGEEIAPEQGPHDVSGNWQLPLCARQTGLWLRGLMGAAASTTVVGSRGGWLFKAQPLAGDTITIGGTTKTFVSGSPSTDEIQIGASLLATVDNAVTEIDGETLISATDKGQILFVEHDTADDTGDSVVTASSAPQRVQAFAATLKGGGNTRHRFTDQQNTGRPSASVEVEHTDLSGSYKYRLIDGMMVRQLSFSKARSGQAMMTADVLGRRETPSATRTLTASPTELAPARFSYLGGSILFQGTCIGTIDSAGVTLGHELTAGGFDACAAGDVAVIGEPWVGDTSASIELTGRFPLSVLHDAAFAGTPVGCELFFINPASGAVLDIHLPAVYLARPSETYQGRGLVTASVAGAAYRDPTAGYRYRADLYGPVTAYA